MGALDSSQASPRRVRQILRSSSPQESRPGAEQATVPSAASSPVPTPVILADPRRGAYLAWAGALAEISTRWEARSKKTSAAGREPAWLGDEPLMDAVREAILATVDHATFGRALEAVDAWRGAWLRLLAEEDPPPRKPEDPGFPPGAADPPPVRQGNLPFGLPCAGPTELGGETARAYRDRTRAEARTRRRRGTAPSPETDLKAPGAREPSEEAEEGAEDP